MQPASAPGTFDEIYRSALLIEEQAADPETARLAREVQFKAEHLYRRPHLQPEGVLQELLDERIRRLEAVLRAGPMRAAPPARDAEFPDERRKAARP